MSATRDFPFHHHPRGWYQVAWSPELAPGDVRPARYFGQDLVIYRTDAGRVVVLEGHCLHMGAHLGHGGRVAGDDIVCPFHGWRWGCDGSNLDIPYSNQQPIKKRLQTWTVLEQSGLVLVWYDRSGGVPDHEPPPVPEFEDPDYYPVFPHGAAADTVRFVPQLLLENAVDFPHLKYVHNWNVGEPGMEKYENRGESFAVVSYGAIETSRGPARLRTEIEAWGVSLIYSHLTGLRDMGFVSSCTPIDDMYSEIRLSTAVRKPSGDAGDEPDSLAKAMIKGQVDEVIGGRPGGDRDIWEHMIYRARPPMVREEATGMRALREWAATFYVDPAAEEVLR
jgi:3-ketosteroid 9alpha-monooxygenase subunit A